MLYARVMELLSKKTRVSLAIHSLPVFFSLVYQRGRGSITPRLGWEAWQFRVLFTWHGHFSGDEMPLVSEISISLTRLGEGKGEVGKKGAMALLLLSDVTIINSAV